MKAKKIAVTIALLIIAAASFFVLADMFSSGDSAFYTGVQKKLNERLFTATAIFGLTKLVAGVISFFQSIHIEAGLAIAGVSMSPLEVLAPINGTIDTMAGLFLFAMGAIVFQKLLILMAGWVSFKVVVPVAMLMMGIYVWTGRKRLRNVTAAFLAFAVMSAVIVPLSVAASAVVEKHILGGMIAEAQESIEAREFEIKEIQGQFDKEAGAWQSFKDRMAVSAKIKGAVSDLMSYTKALVGDMLNAFIAMMITTVVIPLLTLFAFWALFKWLLRWLKEI